MCRSRIASAASAFRAIQVRTAVATPVFTTVAALLEPNFCVNAASFAAAFALWTPISVKSWIAGWPTGKSAALSVPNWCAVPFRS